MGRLLKAMLNEEVLLIAADTTDICEEARNIHGLTPVTSAVLGRTMTAALIMASQLKNEEDSVTITLNGKGPAGTVTVVADALLHVKGYVENPAADLPPTPKGKLDVSGAVGSEGFLTVVKDIGYKEPYTGRISLVSGEIAEDIAQYYAVSEQQPSVVFLTVIVETDFTVAKAGGVVVQPLPYASEDTLQKIEAAVPKLQEFGRMLRRMTTEEALKAVFSGMDIQFLEDSKADYYCSCSRERLEKVVISLGREELEDIIEKDRHAEIICRFCKTDYQFTEEELKELLLHASTPSL